MIGQGKAVHQLGRIAALLTVIVALTIAAPSIAAEQITSFSSSVTLATDGSVDVTETIDVIAEGYSIRRGIFRDIPTSLVNPDNSRLRSNLDVLAVSRDGSPEPWTLENIEGGVRIRIGDPDVLLNYGTHRYSIRYTMTRMGRSFADHDEIYWNATGNYWEFPILKAVARIVLPDGAVISDVQGYTGGFGSTTQDVAIERPNPDTAIVRTTSELAPQEGLTVAVSFNKGILLEPTGTQKFVYWLSDRRDVLLPLIAVLIVLLYNVFAWSSVGRDPPKGTIIPLFYPPKGYSPALVEYVDGMGWKNSGWTAFTASIFNLGVKGLVVIDNTMKDLKVTLTGKQPENLPTGEKLLYEFISSRGTLTVDKTNGATIQAKRGEFVKAIERENQKVYFVDNTPYVIGGFLLGIACLAGLVWSGVLDLGWLFGAVVVGIVIGILTSVLRGLFTGKGFGNIFALVWFVVIGVNFLSAITGSVMNFHVNTAALAAVSIVVIHVVFAFLMRAPTIQGRALMDEIDGFKMYLKTAEESRLNFDKEPPLTVSRFEALLPYAIALGVEKPWSERFEGELARNAVPDATGGTYSPRWYSGYSSGSFNSNSIANTVSSAAAGMSAAMIASQPASSSSSGGGGGGFSGGGGGGGGGGGW